MSMTFQALVVDGPAPISAAVQNLSINQLPPGEVLVKVAYSGINYKDGLACSPGNAIVKSFPFVPGIDLSGYVVSSSDSRFREGQAVIATGYEIGVSRFGGFSQYASLHADWLVPLPEGMSLKEAMLYGTAGFTAALSIERMEENGLAPEKGDVLVTGATGGVGGAAIAMLSRKGYRVIASTGRKDAADYLLSLGASEVISREDVLENGSKPLNKQRWQGAIDPVGGPTLAAILSKIAYSGTVAVSGLTGGTDLPSTVMPFILRGVNLLGIDSVYCPAERRLRLWQRMGGDLKPEQLSLLEDREIGLHDLPDALIDILQSRTRGRIVVRL